MKLCVKPIEGCANVVDLASSIVMQAFAQSSASKIETQHRKSKRVQRLHRMIDNFVVHGAAIKPMRMTDQSRMSCIRLAFVEQGLQPSRRSLNKERLDSVRHVPLLPPRRHGRKVDSMHKDKS